MDKKRGQISLEIILIVALVLIFTIPFLTGLLGDFNSRATLERKVQTATDLAQNIETVANLGPGNSITFTSHYQIKIQDNMLIIPGETEEQNVAVQIKKTIEDDEINEGQIKIVNDQNEGVVMENFPVVTKAKPAVGPQGKLITLTGEYFSNTTKVYFNAQSATSSYLNETTMEFRVPAISGGVYPVYVIKFIGNEEMQSNSIDFSVAGIGG